MILAPVHSIDPSSLIVDSILPTMGPHHRLLLLDTTASSGRGRAGYHEATFDANMVIILAALLCALICALGLNSIVRCALRCSRRSSFEPPAPTSAGLALRQIPVVIYPSSALASSECAICLGELANGDKVRMLPGCSHGFHVACIDTWLLSHSSCPTCRNSLLLLPDAGELP